MLQGENTQYMVFDKADKRYLESIYQDSYSWDAKVDDAMKYPTVEIARAIKEYLEWRSKFTSLCILKREITTNEVE